MGHQDKHDIFLDQRPLKQLSRQVSLSRNFNMVNVTSAKKKFATYQAALGRLKRQMDLRRA